MGTRPQTLSGLADSPAGLAAWLLDHGDGYAQPAAAMTSAVVGRTVNGHSAGDLTRDELIARCLTIDAADSIDELVRARRAIEIRIAGEPRFVAVADVARFRDAPGVPPPGPTVTVSG